MKLPKELIAKIRTLPCWPPAFQGPQDLDAIELIVRHCAKVCADIEVTHWQTHKRQPGPHAYDPHYQGLSDGAGECERAILTAFNLEDK